MTAYSMYRSADPTRLTALIAHGSLEMNGVELAGAVQGQVSIAPVSGNGMDQGRFLLKSISWLRRSRSDFDVFHGLSAYHFTVAPAVIAERLGLPAVVKVASHRADLATKPGVRRWSPLPAQRQRMVGGLSAMIATSSEIAKELAGYGVADDRIARIPNGVDTTRFRPVQEERQRVRERLGWRELPTVLFVGAVQPRKQPHLLVDAIAELRRRWHIECQLVLAGPLTHVSYVRKLEERVQAQQVQSHVIMTDFVPNPENLYHAADIFVLPSKKEGMANALLEAMSTGLPVVVTDVSGSRDLVQDGTTGRILTDPERELSIALRDYVLDAALREAHGSAGRRTILQSFSVESALRRHEQLFAKVSQGDSVAGIGLDW